MQITETFTGKAGGALVVQFWADGTLKIIYNGVESGTIPNSNPFGVLYTGSFGRKNRTRSRSQPAFFCLQPVSPAPA